MNVCAPINFFAMLTVLYSEIRHYAKLRNVSGKFIAQRHERHKTNLLTIKPNYFKIMRELIFTILLTMTIFEAKTQDIFDAYEKHNYTKLEKLLSKGADPNELNINGITLMFKAAWTNDVELAKILVRYGGKVELSGGSCNMTSLHTACQQNSYEVAKFFIENGADVNSKCSCAGNQTPIRFACKTGSIKLVSMLLEAGANIEESPDDKMTPLIQAARSNHYDLCEFLIQKGANVNAYARDKECALNEAIKNNNTEIVKLLLNNGALVTYIDEFNHSSLDLAKKVKNQEIIKLIKSKL